MLTLLLGPCLFLVLSPPFSVKRPREGDTWRVNELICAFHELLYFLTCNSPHLVLRDG